MNILRRLKDSMQPVLPPTHDGYQPPQGATAYGWTCTNPECGNEGLGAVLSRWPKSCPRCGWAPEPKLNEPWRHEAERHRLLGLIEGETDGSIGHRMFQIAYLGWQFKDGLLKADLPAATAARDRLHADLEAYLRTWPGRAESVGRQLIVRPALEAGQAGWAADELLDWYSRTSTDDLENNSQRTNARCLFMAQLEFAAHPAAANHPSRDLILRQLEDMAGRLRQYLSTDLDRQYAEYLSRERRWGATSSSSSGRRRSR